MKATEQNFPVVLFITILRVVLTSESVDEILKCDHSNESYWAVLSCGSVYYTVQGGSNFRVWTKSWSVTIQVKTIWVVLSCGTICYAELCGSTFFCQSVNETLVDTAMKAIVKGGGAGSVLF